MTRTLRKWVGLTTKTFPSGLETLFTCLKDFILGTTVYLTQITTSNLKNKNKLSKTQIERKWLKFFWAQISSKKYLRKLSFSGKQSGRPSKIWMWARQVRYPKMSSSIICSFGVSLLQRTSSIKYLTNLIWTKMGNSLIKSFSSLLELKCFLKKVFILDKIRPNNVTSTLASKVSAGNLPKTKSIFVMFTKKCTRG